MGRTAPTDGKHHEAATNPAGHARKRTILMVESSNWTVPQVGEIKYEAGRLQALEERNAELKQLLVEKMREVATLRELLARKEKRPPSPDIVHAHSQPRHSDRK